MKNKKLWITTGFSLFILVFIFVATQLIQHKNNSQQNNSLSYQQPKLKKTYDVIVVGGEPEGVAAAVAAARNGSKTLLIEKRDGLGGLFTYGMLNFLDIGKDMNNEPVNAGIFKEWHNLVGNQSAFDIKDAKAAFMKLVKNEPNLTLALETDVVSVIKDGNKLTGLKIKDYQNKEKEIHAQRFIDSTKDADLAVMAGAPYFTGGEDIGFKNRKMSVTLMIHLKDVDWEGIKRASKDGVFGGGTVYNNTAWGYSDLHTAYKPSNAQTRLRGLNIAKQKDGSVYINALQIFGVDGLNEESKKEALDIGKNETKHIVKFLNEHFPGFEQAKIASYPSELYIRETRHIKAEYQLPMSDLWENRDHWDSIALGGYPVDIQATSTADYGYVLAVPTQYAIPFRSLVPLKIDGLLIASKAAGYDSLAAGSARVVPTGMSVAQAAGVASAMSIEHQINFREMSKDKSLITTLQKKLKNQGAHLFHFELDYPYQNEWYYPAIKKLLSLGVIKGGYENKLPVDEPMINDDFVRIISAIERVFPDKGVENVNEVTSLLTDKDKTLTRDQAAQLILKAIGIDCLENEAWQKAIELGIVDKTLNQRLPENREILTSEGYQLFYLLFKQGKNY